MQYKINVFISLKFLTLKRSRTSNNLFQEVCPYNLKKPSNLICQNNNLLNTARFFSKVWKRAWFVVWEKKELCLLFERKNWKGALHVIWGESLKRSFACYLREKFEKELCMLCDGKVWKGASLVIWWKILKRSPLLLVDGKVWKGASLVIWEKRLKRSFACYFREKIEKEFCLLFDGKVWKGAPLVIWWKILKRSFVCYFGGRGSLERGFICYFGYPIFERVLTTKGEAKCWCQCWGKHLQG